MSDSSGSMTEVDVKELADKTANHFGRVKSNYDEIRKSLIQQAQLLENLSIQPMDSAARGDSCRITESMLVERPTPKADELKDQNRAEYRMIAACETANKHDSFLNASEISTENTFSTHKSNNKSAKIRNKDCVSYDIQKLEQKASHLANTYSLLQKKLAKCESSYCSAERKCHKKLNRLNEKMKIATMKYECLQDNVETKKMEIETKKALLKFIKERNQELCLKRYEKSKASKNSKPIVPDSSAQVVIPSPPKRRFRHV